MFAVIIHIMTAKLGHRLDARAQSVAEAPCARVRRLRANSCARLSRTCAPMHQRTAVPSASLTRATSRIRVRAVKWRAPETADLAPTAPAPQRRHIDTGSAFCWRFACAFRTCNFSTAPASPASAFSESASCALTQIATSKLQYPSACRAAHTTSLKLQHQKKVAADLEENRSAEVEVLPLLERRAGDEITTYVRVPGHAIALERSVGAFDSLEPAMVAERELGIRVREPCCRTAVSIRREDGRCEVECILYQQQCTDFSREVRTVDRDVHKQARRKRLDARPNWDVHEIYSTPRDFHEISSTPHDLYTGSSVLQNLQYICVFDQSSSAPAPPPPSWSKGQLVVKSSAYLECWRARY
ncbi:hypothetical protein B0H11DRAFT_1925808 [Mycena galericulata]|nr:hypothetical protein B0H11DRAFT_1925808 [Mycena galericulata]